MKDMQSNITRDNESSTTGYNRLEQYLLDKYQHDFPITPRPFHEIADELEVDPAHVIATFQKLRDAGVISRVGPVITPNTIGISVLAALSVPEEDLIRTADLISNYPEVNHNYEREHRFNLWFVIVANNEKHLNAVLDDIAEETGSPLLRLPLLDAYHIDLGFKLAWN